MPEINLNRVVVHEITKEEGSREATFKTSSNLFEPNDKIKEVVSKLHSRYASRHITRCQFSETGTVFKNQIQLHKERNSDASFLNFSIESTRSLAIEMQTHANSKGGYILFAEYNHYIAAFIIRNTSGSLFEYKDNNFRIKDVQHLDIEKFKMACRLDKNMFYSENTNERYLSIMKMRSSEVSQFFTRWVGISNKLSSKEATEALLKTLDFIVREDLAPCNDNNEPLKRSELFLKVGEYISSRPGEGLDVNQLSQHLFGNEHETKILRLSERNNTPLDTIFNFNQKPLFERLSQVVVKSDGFNLKFKRRLLVDENVIEINDDNHVIIKSSTIAEILRSEK